MKKEIILINGAGGVGKDTFVAYCGLYAPIINLSTVDRVKEAARILGWNGGKGEKDRLFLSNLKLLAVDYNDHSCNYIKENVRHFLEEQDEVPLMFIHVREPGEIDRFKREFGAKTLLIKNKNIPQIMSNMADSNVENYDYDFIVLNDDGRNELRSKARQFVCDLFHLEIYGPRHA